MSQAASSVHLQPDRARAWTRMQEVRPLLFGVRTAMAAIVALWLAMWLQLDNPRWAAWTVMALALPTRGQIVAKGLWRATGTLLGLIAGIVGVALFAQSPIGMGAYLAAVMTVAALIAGYLPALAAYGTTLTALTACLIAAESAATPLSAFGLAMQRTSAIAVGIICAYLASTLADIFQESRSAVASAPIPLPPPLTVFANGQRVFIAFCVAWSIWIATAWSSGPIFIVLVGALLLNFATVPNINRSAWLCLWGAGLGQAVGLILKFTVLTSTPSFGVLAAAIFPFLFFGGAGMTDRRSLLPTMGFNISFLLAIQPLNPMQYDLSASLNEALAVFLGIALVVAAYKFIRPGRTWKLP